MKKGIKYKIKTATKQEICSHLKECSDHFEPPLAQRVDIQEYSERIFCKSVTFEAWVSGTLVGLLAAYFNDMENHLGYVTNVSTIKNYRNSGIGSKLMAMCIKYAKQHYFSGIKLEVAHRNVSAIRLYDKFGFVRSMDKKYEDPERSHVQGKGICYFKDLSAGEK